MPDLKIELVARNELGNIVALITPHGVVDAQSASLQIARGDASYVTGPDSFVRVPVRSIAALGGPYLYANWDGSQRNNLHDIAAVRVRTLTTVPCADAVFAVERPTLRERAAAGWDRMLELVRMLGAGPAPTCADCAHG
jgi:hypothetical protein